MNRFYPGKADGRKLTRASLCNHQRNRRPLRLPYRLATAATSTKVSAPCAYWAPPAAKPSRTSKEMSRFASSHLIWRERPTIPPPLAI